MFVPRASSEFLAEQAIRRLRRRSSPIHVDVATGAGAVALAVAHEVPHAQAYGSDIARDAVIVARANARRLGLANASFMVGDLFGAFPSRLRGIVDVVTLHPPYVARDEMRELPEEIVAWEPAHTLTDRSVDGLGLIGRTADEAGSWLRSGGWLAIEVSPDRARDVSSVMRGAGFVDLKSTVDREFKVSRVVVGRWP